VLTWPQVGELPPGKARTFSAKVYITATAAGTLDFQGYIYQQSAAMGGLSYCHKSAGNVRVRFAGKGGGEQTKSPV